MLGCFQHSLREERQEFSQHAASLMSSLVFGSLENSAKSCKPSHWWFSVDWIFSLFLGLAEWEGRGRNLTWKNVA